jgi:hypothetical protein
MQSRFVWENNLPNCGTNNGAISCVVTQKDFRQLTFKHKEITLSMSHGWGSEELRVIVTLENAGAISVPVDARLWIMTRYETLEDLIAESDPTQTSRAKRPRSISNTSGMLDTGSIGQSTSSPVARSLPGSQAPRILPGQDGAASNRSARISNRSKVYDSATKWTEIRARSQQTGEVRFPYEPGTIYVALSFNINGTNYVYRLARR